MREDVTDIRVCMLYSDRVPVAAQSVTVVAAVRSP